MFSSNMESASHEVSSEVKCESSRAQTRAKQIEYEIYSNYPVTVYKICKDTTEVYGIFQEVLCKNVASEIPIIRLSYRIMPTKGSESNILEIMIEFTKNKSDLFIRIKSDCNENDISRDLKYWSQFLPEVEILVVDLISDDRAQLDENLGMIAINSLLSNSKIRKYEHILNQKENKLYDIKINELHLRSDAIFELDDATDILQSEIEFMMEMLAHYKLNTVKWITEPDEIDATFDILNNYLADHNLKITKNISYYGEIIIEFDR